MNAPNAQPDRLQELWANPEPFEILRNDELGLLITLDRHPVVPDHALLVSRFSSWESMTDRQQAQFLLAGRIVCEAASEIFTPSRGVGYAIWGNQAATPHIHIVPRNVKQDGAAFFDPQTPLPPEASADQLLQSQQRYKEYFAQHGIETSLRQRLENL